MNKKDLSEAISQRLAESAYSEGNLSLDGIIKAHKDLLNDQSDIRMKERIQKVLLFLLIFVIFGLFYLVLSQGSHELLLTSATFNLSDSTIKIFNGGSILIIYWLLARIVKYHFPENGIIGKLVDYYLLGGWKKDKQKIFEKVY